MPSKTPHQTLGLPPQATADEIKHAYRVLVLKWHPDRHEKDKAVATKRFIEINEAYKQLTESLDLESNFEEPILMHTDDNDTKKKGQSSNRSFDRQSSESSSEFSDDSYGDSNLRRTRSFDSGYYTTPSSSFKESSPTNSYFPPQAQSPHFAPNYGPYPNPYQQQPHFHLNPGHHRHPERPSPTSTSPSRYPHIETWRTGSDLPDGLRQATHHAYSNAPRLSQPRPRASSIPKPPPPSIIAAYPASPAAAAAATGIAQRHTPYCQPALPSSALPRLSHSVVRPPPASSTANSLGSSSPHSDKRYQNHFGQVVAPVLHTSPYDVPLGSIGLGPAGEWTYALPLALEELFTGVRLSLPITRRMLSGRTKTVPLDLDIPAGCRTGSKILCKRVGHEMKPGSYQDIAFIVEPKDHDRFRRERDDLVLDVRVPLVDALRSYGGEVPFAGMDGQVLSFYVDFPRTGCFDGRSVIKGAGMPARHGGKVVGRGDMIVNWELIPIAPKKTMGVFKRLWKR